MMSRYKVSELALALEDVVDEAPRVAPITSIELDTMYAAVSGDALLVSPVRDTANRRAPGRAAQRPGSSGLGCSGS
jgi:hypothetical protein